MSIYLCFRGAHYVISRIPCNSLRANFKMFLKGKKNRIPAWKRSTPITYRLYLRQVCEQVTTKNDSHSVICSKMQKNNYVYNTIKEICTLIYFELKLFYRQKVNKIISKRFYYKKKLLVKSYNVFGPLLYIKQMANNK